MLISFSLQKAALSALNRRVITSALILVTTHRGDQHLMVGLPSIIARHERNEESVQIKRIIVDREGMATEFLASLQARSDEQ